MAIEPGGHGPVQVQDFPHMGCNSCAARKYQFCEAVGNLSAGSGDETRPHFLAQSEHTVKQRRFLVPHDYLSGSVPAICSGWAARVSALPDGRRQIFSFLLPGDFIWSALFLEGKREVAIEAITDVQYRNYSRQQLKNYMYQQPQLLDGVLNTWMRDLSRVDRLIVDLGRRAGEERVARLILELMQRLNNQNMASPPAELVMDFPLRQHHIADATGLTQVHAHKIIAKFRRDNIIQLHSRKLSILHLEKLCNIGNFAYYPERASSNVGAK